MQDLGASKNDVVSHKITQVKNRKIKILTVGKTSIHIKKVVKKASKLRRLQIKQIIEEVPDFAEQNDQIMEEPNDISGANDETENLVIKHIQKF